MDISYHKKISKTCELIKKSTYSVAFTGAGISTESGIPDFRSPNGLWQRFRIVTYQEFIIDRKARNEFWKMKRELIQEIINAKPNNAHNALAELEKRGFLKYVITQNIDGLHQMAGNKSVIELHGNQRGSVCLDCEKVYPLEEVLKMLKEQELDLRCEVCGGIIKPTIVFFGEPMPEKELLMAQQIANKCELMFVIGTSLQVEPAASIPRIAYQNGAKLIFINKVQTEWDWIAEIIFYDSAGKVLKDILDVIKSEKF
ncbi:NAD-dependent deacylase [Thermodesulfovibrio yellowstonii]|uniref:NAD-dependent protein deacetylase n=1 Tax=Thermodesulfovibrio yellowstonii TaxID=28262 RepID=A0A9W6GEN1_9BACT|nr:NAD-dependent deacylase [Thermodesulfovibrio islandicus]GLI53919.1 NAD-dependent protein deacetylase [Thermodesulfovibrio islandicus]